MDVPDDTPDASNAQHTRFLAWVSSKHIVIDGLRAAIIPGKGQGIIATRAIHTDETLIHVPASALLVVPQPDASSGLSVHGAMALRLMEACLNGTVGQEEENGMKSKVDGGEVKQTRPPLALWASVMPNRAEMEGCMPLTWEDKVTNRLPEGARVLLQKQRDKFERDWTAVLRLDNASNTTTNGSHDDLDPSLKTNTALAAAREKDQYRYFWLLVSTRCFYWDFPHPAAKRTRRKEKSKNKKRSRDDCMAMAPFIDLFNHAVDGNPVTYNENGFTITADREYAQNEEIYFSYGVHGNDLLLVEYGFTLPENPHDTLRLDAPILRRLHSGVDKEKVRLLEDAGMLGDYTLLPLPAASTTTTPSSSDTSSQPPQIHCHRTQTTLYTTHPRTTPTQLTRFLTGATTEDDWHHHAKNWVIVNAMHVVGEVGAEMEEAVRFLEGLREEGKGKGMRGVEATLARWGQAGVMLEAAFEALEGHPWRI